MLSTHPWNSFEALVAWLLNIISWRKSLHKIDQAWMIWSWGERGIACTYELKELKRPIVFHHSTHNVNNWTWNGLFENPINNTFLNLFSYFFILNNDTIIFTVRIIQFLSFIINLMKACNVPNVVIHWFSWHSARISILRWIRWSSH